MIDKTKKYAIYCTIVVNIFFLALCLIFGILRFGAADDYFMARILEGVYGNEYNVHLVFVNVVYGYVLLPLYHLFPKIGWYYIGELFLVFGALNTITYVVIRRIGLCWGIIVSMLLVAALATDYYLVVQFTYCGIILTAAGMLAVGESLRDVKRRLRLMVWGCVLMLLGAILRWPSFWMGTPVFVIVLLLECKSIWENKKIVVLVSVAFLGSLVALKYFDECHYKSSEYRQYMDYNGIRALFVDSRNFDDRAVYEDLEEIGLSGRDYNMLKNWVFYDKKVYSMDSLRILNQILQKHQNEIDWRKIPSLQLRALTQISNSPVMWIWFALCALILFSNRGCSVYPILSLSVILALSFYMILLNRTTYHVVNGFWVYATVLGVLYIGKMPKNNKKVSVGIMFAIAMANVWIYYVDANKIREPVNGRVKKLDNNENASSYERLWEYIDHSPDSSVFLVPLDDYITMSYYRKPPYLAEPMGSWKKVIPMGYWNVLFPDVEKVLHEKSIENPLQDAVKEHVYVINERSLTDFLERHYYEHVYREVVGNFDGLLIYKYVTEMPKR